MLLIQTDRYYGLRIPRKCYSVNTGTTIRGCAAEALYLRKAGRLIGIMVYGSAHQECAVFHEGGAADCEL